jgi:hypothetical protein
MAAVGRDAPGTPSTISYYRKLIIRRIQMKKLLATILAAALAATLAACDDDSNSNGNNGTSADGGTNAANGEDSPPSSVNVAAAVNGYVMPFDGFDIVMGDNIETVLEALGEPDAHEKTESCAFPGYDHTYQYGSILIDTFSPDGTANHVLGVTLRDDSISTGQGAYMGMSVEEVTALYGQPTETTGAAGERHRYLRDGMSLEFLFSNDAAIEIFYRFDAASEWEVEQED